MKYLIAFDKFKGALPATEAGAIANEIIRESDASAMVKSAPLTDGGEGFATILATALGGDLHEMEVPGPRFSPIMGKFAIVDGEKIPAAAMARLELPDHLSTSRIGIVEMASASGYECLSASELDPWKTSTIGTGVLMQAAIDAGAKALIIGIGGSATNDCGAGALEAIGVHYYDRELQAISNLTPELFKLVNTVGSTSHLLDSFPPVRIACDVTNPLVGPLGATRVFGPQKGLRTEDVDRMERALDKMARRFLGLFGKNPATWEDHLNEPGAGAAGGIGFALRHALPDSRFVEGFPLVAELLDLPLKASEADVIVTGEGRLDESSLGGKGPIGLIRLNASKKAYLFTGSADPTTVDKLKDDYPKLEVVTISDPDWSLEKAIAATPNSLANALRGVVLHSA